MKFFAAIALSILAAGSQTASADVIYSESFSVAGKGWDGNEHDVSGVNWNISFADPGAIVSSADPTFLGVSGGRFLMRNLDGSNTGGASYSWISDISDVSGFTNLNLSLDYELLDTENSFEGNDEFVVAYSLDGGAAVELLSTSTETAGVQPFSSSLIPDGSTLQLFVTGNNNAATESFYFDNVLLTGDVVGAAVPEPAAALAVLVPLLVFDRVRRRKHEQSQLPS